MRKVFAFQKNPTRKASLKLKKGLQPIRNQKQLTMGIRVEQIDSSYLKKAFPIGASLP